MGRMLRGSVSVDGVDRVVDVVRLTRSGWGRGGGAGGGREAGGAGGGGICAPPPATSSWRVRHSLPPQVLPSGVKPSDTITIRIPLLSSVNNAAGTDLSKKPKNPHERKMYNRAVGLDDDDESPLLLVKQDGIGEPATLHRSL